MKYVVVLVYVFSFGIADCLWVNVNRSNHELVSMLGRSLITTALFIGLVFWVSEASLTTFGPGVSPFGVLGGASISALGTCFSFQDIALAIGLSVVCYGGQYFYVRSLKHTPVSVSITLVSILTFLISIIVSIVVYKETVGITAVLMMLITLVGVLLLVEDFNWKVLPGYRIGMLYILLGSICWGLAYSFFKFPIKALGAFNFSLLLESTILFLNVLLFYFKGLQFVSLGAAFGNSWKYLIALGVLIFIGTVCNSLSYSYFGVTTLNIVGKVGIVVPIAYALLFLKETITTKQTIGILLLLSGATFVSLLGGY